MASFIVIKRTPPTPGMPAYVATPDEVSYRLLNFSGITTSFSYQLDDPEVAATLEVVQTIVHEGERTLLEEYRRHLMSDTHPYTIYCNQNGITRTFSEIED